MSLSSRIQIEQVTTLAADWSVLKKTLLSFRRADGAWQRLTRETYDRGNGATILLYDEARGTVVLTRQFRYPAFVNGHDDLLIETPAGLLDAATPEARIRAELEEETGFRIVDVVQIFDAFMSPGSVTERLHFFVGRYTPADRQTAGGGIAEEGEDIATFEIPLAEALAMVADGRIRDDKTIMLLQYAALYLLPRAARLRAPRPE